MALRSSGPHAGGHDLGPGQIAEHGSHGGLFATIVSAVALLFSGMSYYESSMKSAELTVYVPAMVHYAAPRAHLLTMADELFALVLAGKIVSEPRQVFALDQAADAHRALESRGTTGATILIP